MDKLEHYMSCRSLLLDLQWFAKDGEGGEKTEEPTSKKLSDARKDGKVAKSKELTMAAGLVALFLTMKVFIGFVGNGLYGLFETFYTRIPDFVAVNRKDVSGSAITSVMQEAVKQLIVLGIPFFLAGIVSAIGINILQVKWLVTTKPLKPDLSKFNPINGVKRLFSKESFMELLRSAVKLTMIGWIAYSSIKGRVNELLFLCGMPVLQAVQWMGDVVISTGLKISLLYVVIGIVDFIYQKWKYKEDMKMTKQEVKDEMKNAEGDPEIKGKQKARMREASQRRMMQEVPNADVVITNPTHLAVALKYDTKIAQAPIVVAKGADYLAMRIREAAKAANVEIVEDVELAHALYDNVEVGDQIPQELYQMVAEILATVYRLQNKL